MTTTAPSGFTRRRFLQSLGTIGVAGAAAVVTRNAIATAPQRAQVHRPPHFEGTLWHDPRTWPNGRVPGPGDVAQITRPVILDANARVAGVEIAPQGALVFAPQATARLESSGNVVVRGRLAMRPQSAAVVHTLRFVDVNEKAFKGGGMQPIASDVGLWVMDKGVLDAQGTPRAGWNRTGTDPTWLKGDEILVAPYQERDYGTGQDRDGAPAAFATHKFGTPAPTVQIAGHAFTTEVFNLTRNVILEGTAQGRAHVFIHAMVPQQIRHVVIRHMGPRQADPDRGGTLDVLGRYGLHFHHCRDGTRGSLVEGVVVRNCGAHAFVPHGSHGITFRDCLSYDTTDIAYWWDSDRDGSYPENATHDVAYEHCAAFLVRDLPDMRRTNRMSAFRLGQGERNTCVDCVAAGVQGGKNAAGFQWPESANGLPNVWRFEDCTAHNNRTNGMFVWQNGPEPGHVIDRFTVYRCGGAGIEHGAYRNNYHYRDALLVGCGAGVHLHAVSQANGPLNFERITVHGGACALYIDRHSQPANHFGVLRDWDIRKVDRPVHLREADRNERGWYDLIDFKIDGEAPTPEDIYIESMHPESIIRVKSGGETFEVKRS